MVSNEEWTVYPIKSLSLSLSLSLSRSLSGSAQAQHGKAHTGRVRGKGHVDEGHNEDILGPARRY